METKSLIFLALSAVAIPVGIRALERLPGARDACAFLLVLGTTRADLLGIHFYSREWYRGTTRGFEVCWLDFLWFFLWVDEYRRRRPEDRTPLPPSTWATFVFLAYNALNVALSEPQLFGLFELANLVRALMVFWAVAHYVKSARELRLLVWALGMAVTYEFGATVYTRVVQGHARAEGTLSHPNSLSMYNLMSIPVLLAVALSDAPKRLRQLSKAAAVFGTISVLLTISRAGVTALGLILLGVGFACGSIRLTWKTVGQASLGGVLAVALFLKLGPAFEARFREGTLEKEYEGRANEGRGVYFNLSSLMIEDSVFGCGLNNWSYWVTNRYGAMLDLHYLPYTGTDEAPPTGPIPAHSNIDAPQAPPGHSLYAITLGETGWPGVILFGVLWLRWLSMPGRFLFHRTSAFVSRFGTGAFFGVAGAFAQSFSEWEIRQTPLLFLLNLLLGAAAALHPIRPQALGTARQGRARRTGALKRLPPLRRATPLGGEADRHATTQTGPHRFPAP